MMPYRIKWTANILWVDAGIGCGQEAYHKSTTLAFNDSLLSTSVCTTTFTNADIATLTNGMVADLTTQLEQPATQLRIQNWGNNTFPATL
jgi:hypothetical protein